MTKELRRFGVTLGIVLGLMGGLFFWRGREYYFYFFIISAVFFFFGLALPSSLKSIYKIWMTLTGIIGCLITGIILCILFYLIVTPIGLLSRLFGRDSLRLKFDKNATNSYWIPKETTEFKKENYERQF